MKTSFKYFEFIDDLSNYTSKNIRIDFDTAYSVMDAKSKVVHLMRQALIFRYLGMVYKGIVTLPVPYRTIKEYTANLVDIKVSPDKKDEIDFVEQGLALAVKLLLDPIKDDDYLIVLLDKFIGDISKDIYKDVPMIGSSEFVKMMFTHIKNQWHIANKRLTKVDSSAIFNIYLPVFCIGTDCDKLTIAKSFSKKTYQYGLSNFSSDKDLIEIYNILASRENNLFSLLINIDWTGNSITDLVAIYSMYCVTMDVVDPIKEELLLTAFNRQIISRFTNTLVKDLSFVIMTYPILSNLMRLVYFLTKRYKLKINSTEILDKIFLVDVLSEQKQDIAFTTTLTQDDYVKMHEFLVSKYATDVSISTEAAKDDTSDTTTDEPKDDTAKTEEQTPDEDATATDEPAADDTSTTDSGDTVDTDITKPAEAEDTTEAKKLITSKINDKGKKVIIELSQGETLDTLLLRREIMAYVGTVLNDPPANISSEKLLLLNTIKRYWSNLLSIEALASIVSNIIKIPIRFKTVTE